MADSDLDAIRQARLQEMQSQSGQQGGAGRGNTGQGGEEQQEKQAQENAARQHILSQILEPAAADRIGRIRMVKASRAEDVENRLIMLARSGQLRGRVTEEQLKDILDAISKQSAESGASGGEVKIEVKRRGKGGWDDDDLDDLLEDL